MFIPANDHTIAYVFGTAGLMSLAQHQRSPLIVRNASRQNLKRCVTSSQLPKHIGLVLRRHHSKPPYRHTTVGLPVTGLDSKSRP